MRYSAFELRASDGFILFAQAWEPAEPPDTILGIVHGLGDHSGRYSAIAESFVGAGILVVTYDQRGHGRTGGSLPAFATMLDDIDLLIAEMRRRGDARQFLFGQSLGGNLVLNYAIRRNPLLHGVIASSPLLTPAMPPPAWKSAMARLLSFVRPGFLLANTVNAEDLSHDAEVVRDYRQDPLVHDRVSAILGTSMLDAGKWALKHADQLTIPLLLMHGSGDRLTSANSSREFASRAGALCTLRIWEGLFHELHFETAREEVQRQVLDWICQANSHRTDGH